MLIAALYVSDTSSHSCALSSPRSVNYMVTNTVNSSMTPFGVHLFAPEQQLILEKKVMAVVEYILADFAWFFPHSVNYSTYYTYSPSS